MPCRPGPSRPMTARPSLDQLYDRMSSRLGALAVVRASPVDSHIPERAVRLVPIAGAAERPPISRPVAAPRPLRLLPVPEPVAVRCRSARWAARPMVWRRVSYRFVRASGPERIAVGMVARVPVSAGWLADPAGDRAALSRRRARRATITLPRMMAAAASGCSGRGCSAPPKRRAGSCMGSFA